MSESSLEKIFRHYEERCALGDADPQLYRRALEAAEASPKPLELSAKASAVVPSLRYCPRCETEKVIGAFGLRRKRGKVVPLPYCKACHVAYHTEWRNGKGKERFTTASRASKARYPEREKTRALTRYAISAGRLVPGVCCIGDASCGQAEAHHDDYSKPLEVKWVCRKHHRRLDRLRRKTAAS